MPGAPELSYEARTTLKLSVTARSKANVRLEVGKRATLDEFTVRAV